MLSNFSRLLSCLLLSLPLAAQALKSGPETGGGGGVVAYRENIVLVDLLNIPQAFENTLQWNKNHAPSRISEPSPQAFAFSRAEALPNPAFATTFEILESWETLPFDRVAFSIKSSFFKPLRWMFVDETIPSKDSYRPEILEKTALIQPAAYYQILSPDYFLVRVSRAQWNKLSLFDQAALLIHESLRQRQLGMQDRFDDQSLQKATAILMLCKPSIQLNQYVNYLALNEAALAEKNLGPFEGVTQNCHGPRP